MTRTQHDCFRGMATSDKVYTVHVLNFVNCHEDILDQILQEAGKRSGIVDPGNRWARELLEKLLQGGLDKMNVVRQVSLIMGHSHLVFQGLSNADGQLAALKNKAVLLPNDPAFRNMVIKYLGDLYRLAFPMNGGAFAESLEGINKFAALTTFRKAALINFMQLIEAYVGDVTRMLKDLVQFGGQFDANLFREENRYISSKTRSLLAELNAKFSRAEHLLLDRIDEEYEVSKPYLLNDYFTENFLVFTPRRSSDASHHGRGRDQDRGRKQDQDCERDRDREQDSANEGDQDRERDRERTQEREHESDLDTSEEEDSLNLDQNMFN